jgi:hypothetical protein
LFPCLSACLPLQGDLAKVGCPCLDQGYLPVLRRILPAAQELSLTVSIAPAAVSPTHVLHVSFAVQPGAPAVAPGVCVRVRVRASASTTNQEHDHMRRGVSCVPQGVCASAP